MWSEEVNHFRAAGFDESPCAAKPPTTSMASSGDLRGRSDLRRRRLTRRSRAGRRIGGAYGEVDIPVPGSTVNWSTGRSMLPRRCRPIPMNSKRSRWQGSNTSPLPATDTARRCRRCRSTHGPYGPGWAPMPLPATQSSLVRCLAQRSSHEADTTPPCEPPPPAHRGHFYRFWRHPRRGQDVAIRT
jgi:hypothetical protein